MAILYDLLAGVREAKHTEWEGRVQAARGQTAEAAAPILHTHGREWGRTD